MTYRELYLSALHIISENNDGSSNSDYENRAGYILAAFCNEHFALDTRYRKANQLVNSTFTPSSNIVLSDSFPLKEIFAPAAVYYLGAMLVSDENESLYQQLSELYTKAIASIQNGLPYASESITNCYPELN